MKYGDKRFSVGQTGRSPKICEKVGHAEPNRHGKCFMCGTRLVIPSEHMKDYAARNGMEIVTSEVTLKKLSQKAIDASQPRSVLEQIARLEAMLKSCRCGKECLKILCEDCGFVTFDCEWDDHPANCPMHPLRNT